MSRRARSALLLRGGPLEQWRKAGEDKLVELVKYTRVVVSVAAVPDVAEWEILLAPCMHRVRRPRHGDRFTLPVSLCDVCRKPVEEVPG